MDEILVLTRVTLRADGLLYFILLVEPVLTVLRFLIAILLREILAGRNFGLISNLSGVGPEGFKLIGGAE